MFLAVGFLEMRYLTRLIQVVTVYIWVEIISLGNMPKPCHFLSDFAVSSHQNGLSKCPQKNTWLIIGSMRVTGWPQSNFFLTILFFFVSGGAPSLSSPNSLQCTLLFKEFPQCNYDGTKLNCGHPVTLIGPIINQVFFGGHFDSPFWWELTAKSDKKWHGLCIFHILINLTHIESNCLNDFNLFVRKQTLLKEA